ncbi:MAG: zinc metalloprotease HtpX [Halorhodospira sp.]
MALNRAELWRRRVENLLRAGLLLGALAVLAGLLGYFLAGWGGVFWTTALTIAGAMILARMPAQLVLRQAGALPLAYAQAPQLYDVLTVLSQRAGLEAVPTLHYIPESQLNAFAVGTGSAGGIAVTGGLLRTLDLRETAAVLAHELSHLRHGDTRVLALAALLTQAITYLGFVAQLVLLLSLPWLLSEGATQSVEVLPLLLIVFAPTLAVLIQLALSRAREYTADLEAAALTGDPEALARALHLLAQANGAWLASVFGRGEAWPQHPWLSTHPPLQERLRRLAQLREPPHPPVITPGGTRTPADEWLEIPVRIHRPHP